MAERAAALPCLLALGRLMQASFMHKTLPVGKRLEPHKVAPLAVYLDWHREARKD